MQTQSRVFNFSSDFRAKNKKFIYLAYELQLQELIIPLSFAIVCQVQVSHRGLYVVVPHHLLDSQQIAAILNDFGVNSGQHFGQIPHYVGIEMSNPNPII